MNEPTNHAPERPELAGDLAYTTRATGSAAQPVSNSDRLYDNANASDQLAITLQDLLDLPRQILPEQTYIHLKNAGREAILAVTSLFGNLSSISRSSHGGKVRRHIDVE